MGSALTYRNGGQNLKLLTKEYRFGIWSFTVRPLRIEYPGVWYHVTSRGNEKKKIYNDDQDKRRFLEIPVRTTYIQEVK